MKKTQWRSRRVTIGMLMLFVMACHDAPRNNPMDPELTPGVELLSVNTDPQAGTATIVWSAYAGDQPFQAYQIDRRLSGQVDSETRGTVTDQNTVNFVDTGVEADQTYVYTVSVINTAGFVVESVNNGEVDFPSVIPQITSAVFEGNTASVTLSWDRAVSGFVHYEIQRQIQGEIGPVVLKRITDIDQTTFTDSGLDGNVEYAYRVITRSSTGRELESGTVSGKIHAFLRAWEADIPVGMDVKGMAMDARGRMYVSVGTEVNLLAPMPLSEPDQLYQFDAQGQLITHFLSEPAPGNAFFETADFAADEYGVYVLLKEPFNPFGTLSPPLLNQGTGTGVDSSPSGTPSPTELSQILPPPPGLPPLDGGDSGGTQEGMRCYLNAFNPDGTLRFRWPSDGFEIDLSEIAMAPDGTLWVSQSSTDPLTGQYKAVFYKLDSTTGALIDHFEIQGIALLPYFGGVLAVGQDFGVIKANVGDEVFAVYDSFSGELVPTIFSSEILTNPEDFLVDSGNRLFFLYVEPPSVAVVRDWKFLTGWALERSNIEAPKGIALDSEGNIVIMLKIEGADKIKVRIFEP